MGIAGSSAAFDAHGHAVARAAPVAAAILLGVALGLGIALGTEYGLIPLAMMAGILIVSSQLFRLSFVIFGALMALQSSQQFSFGKLAYLVGVLVAFGAALWHIRRGQNEQKRLAVMGSICMLAVVSFELLVGLARGTDFVQVLRDASPYFLLGATPVLALDAGFLPRRILLGLLLVAGTLTAASWGLVWAVANHHIIVSPIARLLYPSLMLAAGLFAYAVCAVLGGGRFRLAWLILACLLLATALLTGTRTALLLLVIPVFLVLTRRLETSRTSRLVILGLGTVFAVAGAWSLIQISSANTGLLVERFQSLMTDPGADVSLQQRSAETYSALHAFTSNPFFGAGLGQGFAIPGSASLESADTAAGFVGKFGLLGLLLLAATVKSLSRVARGTAQQGRAVLLSYAIFALSVLPLINIFEEKGFSLALILLFAIQFSSNKGTRELHGLTVG